jgi:hypothetical protein
MFNIYVLLLKVILSVHLINKTLSIVDTMPKLYFRHGAVSSAKTLNLLCVAHTYKQQGKQVMLLKPSIDVRFGK